MGIEHLHNLMAVDIIVEGVEVGEAMETVEDDSTGAICRCTSSTLNITKTIKNTTKRMQSIPRSISIGNALSAKAVGSASTTAMDLVFPNVFPVRWSRVHGVNPRDMQWCPVRNVSDPLVFIVNPILCCIPSVMAKAVPGAMTLENTR